MFKANVGALDRAVRVLLGAVLLALVAMEGIGLWGLIGVVPLLTGAMGSCPLYSLLGISTCPAKPGT